LYKVNSYLGYPKIKLEGTSINSIQEIFFTPFIITNYFARRQEVV